jgi:hypothetical protein
MSRRPLQSLSPYESGIWGTADNPCPSERTLAARLDGELDAARAQAVDDHLDACAACASDWERLENLSGCLQSWSRSRGAVEPSPRLFARVLREVAAEGGALRQETLVARRRAWRGAAAAAIVLGIGAWLGFSRDAAHPASLAPWRPRPAEVSAARAPLVVPTFSVPEAELASASRDAVEPDPRWTGGPAPDLAVLSDPAAVSAFAEWLPAVAAQQRIGETVCVRDGRALATWAIPEYEHVRQWGRWIEERERISRESATHDPSAAGLPLADVLPLPDASSFLNPTAAPVGVPASAGSGGLVLRPLPRSARADDPATHASDGVGAVGAPASPPIDLATAVKSGRVRLLADATIDRADVGVEVSASDAPVLVPAGELLSGGAGDRVVAEGMWLRASATAYVVRLPTRPVDRHAGRPGFAPDVVGRVAGPELRALLARGEDAAAILDLVRAQLRGAGLLRPEGVDGSSDGSDGEPSLLALYAGDSDASLATLVQAKRLVAELGADAAGFVAADPSGRFQGFERVDLTGDAGRAVLTRLVAGYLAEARARSAADGSRSGVQATDVLGALSRRAPRLAPADLAPSSSLRGLEPRTGLLLEGVRAGEKRVPLLSGLVRDFVR